VVSVSGVVIVMVGGRDGAAGALVLAHAPILQVIVAAID
jgi:hypothetical protein